MSVNQSALTLGMLVPTRLAASTGSAIGVGPLYNAAIGVMQPAIPETIDAQYGVASYLSNKLGFWLPDSVSDPDKLWHFEHVVQPLFLRGFNTSGLVADMTADAFFKRVDGQIDRDGKLTERRLRSFGHIVDSGVLGIDVYAGLQSGVLVTGNSTVLHGAQMMMRAIDAGDFPWYWGQNRRNSLRQTVKHFLDEEVRSYSIDDRTLANIGIWRKSTQRLFDTRSTDPAFGIAALREEFLLGQKTDPVALPMFALARSSQLLSLPETSIPFIVVGPDKEIRYFMPDKKFDSYTDFFSRLDALRVFGVVGPAKLGRDGKPKSGGLSGYETLLAAGKMRRDGDRIVLQELYSGFGLPYAIEAFNRIHCTPIVIESH